MATDMEFGLLGPVMVRRSGAVVPVPPGKQRAVLAALLLSAGQPVSMDELTEVLWESRPPPSARVTMQNYVMRLRKTLGGAGSRIITQPRGYLFQVATGELDVGPGRIGRFVERLGDGRSGEFRTRHPTPCPGCSTPARPA